jgi:Family of unknown function (DUF5670)
MLWAVLVILLVLWALGFGFHVAGSLIHLLLVCALVVLILQLIAGRRSPKTNVSRRNTRDLGRSAAALLFIVRPPQPPLSFPQLFA